MSNYARHQAALRLTERILEMAEEVEVEPRTWARRALEERLKDMQDRLAQLYKMNRDEIVRQRRTAGRKKK